MMPTRWFFLSLLIPVIVLSVMLVKPLQAKILGEEILLETVPVDPRDLLYGDFVYLNLEIEELDADFLDPDLRRKMEDNDFSNRSEVFVSLVKNSEGVHVAEEVTEQKPTGIYIKGNLNSYIYENASDGVQGSYIRLSYPHDRLFVEEGTGMDIEEALNEGDVLVSLNYYKGYSVINDVVIE